MSFCARLIVLAQHRKLDMREVLKYSLGSLPWSLASPDGSLTKTNKAKLLHLMETSQEQERDVPTRAALIYDGMAVIQSFSGSLIPKTFLTCDCQFLAL